MTQFSTGPNEQGKNQLASLQMRFGNQAAERRRLAQTPRPSDRESARHRQIHRPENTGPMAIENCNSWGKSSLAAYGRFA
jgi:hypothetical protein